MSRRTCEHCGRRAYAAVLGPKVETDVVLGVGDAENDHSLFDACQLTAAVSSAVPSLVERPDMHLDRSPAEGVCDLARRIIDAKRG